MRIRGIDVWVHPSFVLALIWVTYYWGINLGFGPRGVLFGTLLLVSVFICVLGHELAHSFVALRYGIAVQDITLLPIGGVARIEQAPISPLREAKIALAGPLLNVLLTLGLLPAALVMASVRHPSGVLDVLQIAQETSTSGFIVQLLLANGMLALFNLLPAFPMDGGRVLRAGLTLVSGRLTATRIAVGCGQALAGALVIAGFYTRDITLPLVAVFIVISAVTEARMTRVEAGLKVLPVGQFALWDLGGVSPDAPLAYALRGGPRDVVVTDRGRVVGMLWRDDVMVLLNHGAELRVRDVMDPDVVPVRADDSIYDVHRRMLMAGRPAVAPAPQEGH